MSFFHWITYGLSFRFKYLAVIEITAARDFIQQLSSSKTDSREPEYREFHHGRETLERFGFGLGNFQGITQGAAGPPVMPIQKFRLAEWL